MLGLIIFLAIGWGIYRAAKGKGSLEGLLTYVIDPKTTEEKKRGTRWLIAAVVVANFAQASLKNAHRSGEAADWVLGGLWAAGMVYCMWRSWQYLYFGKNAAATPTKHPASAPHPVTPVASHPLPGGTLHAAHAATSKPHPSHAPKKSNDKQFQQL